MILCDTFYGNVIINNCSGFWSKPTMHICSHAHRCDLSLSRARFVFSRCVCCCLSRRRCEWIALDAIVPFFCQLAAHIRGDFWNDLFPLNAVLRTGCISCNKSQTCSANTTCAASTEQELTSFREKREAKKNGAKRANWTRHKVTNMRWHENCGKDMMQKKSESESIE